MPASQASIEPEYRSANTATIADAALTQTKARQTRWGEQPDVLADIYREDTNMVVWQRQLSSTLQQSLGAFTVSNPSFKTSMTVTPDNALNSLREVLGPFNQNELCQNIAELVEMFCLLFELERTGLRLSVLDHAMCPKFHVDQVPCRLVTTYHGIATQWLPQHKANREKLGHGSQGLADEASGLYQHNQDIQQLNCGEIALLKGERWEGTTPTSNT